MIEFKKSILLVEDEAIIAMTTAKVLEQKYEVMTVLKGEEAVELIRSGKRVDLILMDIDLGKGMDGTEAAEIILRDRHIPVVFLSSQTERTIIDKTEKITAYGYVLKDTKHTILFASIEMAFKLYEARKTSSENMKECRILNERLQLAVCLANIGIWNLDVPHNNLIWDERMFQLHGIRQEDFSGDFESWIELVQSEDSENFHAAVQAALRGEKELDTEFRVVWPDGSVRHINAFAQMVRDEEGRPVRMTGISCDVTERKRSEDALRKSEENFRHSLDDSPLGVRIVTTEGETIYANRAILGIYGFSSLDELQTTPIEKRYTAESYIEYKKRDERRQQGEDCPLEYEVGIVRKNGEVRHLLVSRKAQLWNGKKQYQALYRDITERKKGEESIRASLVEKEVLLKEVHHRVKNNLMIIIGLIKMQETKANNKIFNPLLQELEGRIHSMALVHEILHKSKNLVQIDLQNYIETMSAHIHAQFGAERDIQFSVQAVGVKVNLDIAVPCGLILNELITNAYKHAFPGDKPGSGTGRCEIRVTGRQEDSGHVLTVTDNGVGLPVGLFREESETLGLRLIKMLSRQIDGSIELDRSTGTIFRLKFPMAAS